MPGFEVVASGLNPPGRRIRKGKAVRYRPNEYPETVWGNLAAENLSTAIRLEPQCNEYQN